MKKIIYSIFLLSCVLGVGIANGQTITTVAGNHNLCFSGDGGAATTAQISNPFGLVVDGSGNIYFSDYNNNRIRKVTSAGVISTFAGDGVNNYTGDGFAATGAEMSYPPDVAIDGSGNIYLADAGNSVIRKISTAGIITTVAGNGTYGYAGDGAAAISANLGYPASVAVDGSGNIYIADADFNVIRKVTASSGIIKTIAGNSTAGFLGDGLAATTAEMDYPYSVAVDGSGNVFVSDYNNLRIRKITASTGIISTVAGTGTAGYSGDGFAATTAKINYAVAVKTDASGNLYIADYGNYAIRKVTVSTGLMSTIAGTGTAGFSGDGGPATAAKLNLADGVAVDASGNVYIADGANNRIRKVNTSGVISSVIGGVGSGNPATAVSFGAFSSCVDGSGNIYIADGDNDRICKISSGGIATNIVGNGTEGYTGDGGAATSAQLAYPSSVAIDGSGNLYFADQNNAVVRKVNTSGVITTIAGSGSFGYAGDGGPATAAKLNYPSGVAVDASGNVYIADQYNDRIRKVSTAGVITTFAGNGTTGYSGDGGPAASANLNLPNGIALDGAGNLYISDAYNNVVRKVNTSGIINTLAGYGVAGYYGDGGAATDAELYYPNGVTVDAGGNVYIADAGNNVVRKINVLGVITTMAGTSVSGYSGDGGPATAAKLANPTGVTTDASGKLYLADYDNYVVRTVASTLLPAITGTTKICVGGTGTLSNATTGGTWSSLATSVATIGSSSGIMTGVTAGTATIVYSASGNLVITTVSVNATPTSGTITGPSSVCVGSPISLSDGVTGGVWSSSNTTNASVSAGIVTGVTAGTATISYVVTTICGTATSTKTITINPSPVAGTITGPSSVCVGATINMSDAVTGGAWTAGGPSATVSAGVVTGVSAGTNTISYSVTNTCGTATATTTIVVNPLAAPGTITGASSVCVGATINLTDAAAGGAWSTSNTAATVSGGVVTGVTAGTSIVSYSVTNICGTLAATKVISIAPLPSAGIITGASAVCVGSVIALTDVTTGGTWSASNTTASVASGFVNGLSAGTNTISYIVTTACGTASTTKTITVNPTASAGSITGSSTVCVGATLTLTDAAPGGVWSRSNSSVSVSGGVVTGVSAGTSTISYVVSVTCGTATATKTVTINPLPTVSAITGVSNVCVGASITLTDVTAGGAWSSSNTSASVTGGVVTGLVAGSDTIRYAVTNGCGTTTVIKPITVIPSVPSAGTITGGSVVCVGATIALTDATPGGVWSVSNISASVSGGVVTGLSAGTNTVSYVITATCGTATATKTITINPVLSAGTITGASSVCEGATINLTDAIAGGAWSASNTSATVTGGVVTGVTAGTTTISYSVTAACGTATAVKTITINPLPFAGTVTGFSSSVCVGTTISFTDATGGGAWTTSNTNASVAGGVVTGMVAGTSTVSYSVTNGCGTAAATAAITINALASAGTITGASSVCAGASTVLTDATAGGVWTNSNTSASVSGGVVTGITAGTTTISYSVTNGCNTATVTKTVTITPLPTAGTITGAATVCVGASTSLTDATPGGVWTTANTTANVSGGVVTGVSAGANTISYTVTTGCGTAVATSAITINPLPYAGSVSGIANVCVGSSVNLTDLTTGGAWSSSKPTASVSGGTVTGLSAGTTVISYTVSNSCGAAAATLPVTIDPLPSAIGGTASVCEGAITTLSDAGGGTWNSSDATVSVDILTGGVSGITAGTATITYTLGTGCAITRVVTVNPLPAAYTVSGGGSLCVGDTGVHVRISGSNAGIKYQLYIGGVATGTPLRGNGLALDYGLKTVAGTYTVEGVDTVSGCTNNMAGSVKVFVNPLPAAITGTAQTCAGDLVNLSDATTGGEWSSGSTVIADIGSTTGDVNAITAGTSVITYMLTTGCKVTKTFTVHPLPAAISGTSSVCVGATTGLSDASAGGSWNTDNTAIATVTASGGVVTGVLQGIATVTYALPTGCFVTSDVTVNPLPNPGAITGPSSVCLDSVIHLSESVTGGTWSDVGGNASVSAGAVTGITKGIDSIIYSVTNVCGTANTSFVMSVEQCDFTGVPVLTHASMDVQVYPNPNDGLFVVKGSIGSTDIAVSMTLTNMLGQVVYTDNMTAVHGAINERIVLTNRIASGMYLLNIRSAAGNAVFHVVVEQR